MGALPQCRLIARPVRYGASQPPSGGRQSQGAGPFERKTAEERIRALEEAGQLESTAFRATRAFGVEESEDEGLHYFLELADGRVLFLSGQYLYDYEPISDDPDGNQPRSFPCTEFTVRRNRSERYVLDILRGAAVLEPEVIAPPFGRHAWRAKKIRRMAW